MSDFSGRRLSMVVPVTVLATASLGAYLYYSGRLGFKKQFPYVSCSMRKSFASIRRRRPPRLGAPKGGLSVQPDSYPWVHRDKDVDDYKFGVSVPDPYRWLEDPTAPRTAAFVESQNLFTSELLEQCTSRDQFRQLVTLMYNFPKYGCPRKEGDRYYFSYNSGLQNLSTIYFDDASFDDPKIFLDPNEWSEDGTVALASMNFSKKGNLMAYTVNSGGSDWEMIKVLRVLETAVDGEPYEALKDELRFVKLSTVEWTHDDKGFFYSRYAEPGQSNGTLELENAPDMNQYLVYHILGTPQSEDKVVFKMDDKPAYMMYSEVTEDGRYLIIYLGPGCSPGNAVSIIDLHQVPKLVSGAMDFSNWQSFVTPFVQSIDDAYDFIENEGTLFTFKTNKNAPRNKLIRVDIDNRKECTDVVTQHEQDVMSWACAVKGDRMIVCYVRDCSNRLELRRTSTGQLIREIDIPKFGCITSFSGKKESFEVFIGHQSFTSPPTIYRYDTEDNNLSIIRRSVIPGFRLEECETKQVFVDSYDKKVKIPMFIMHKKGIELNGKNPTMLTGYGGFKVSLLPTFSISYASFVMAYNGVIASANIRGGGEYGMAWRNDGCLNKKQNVFDDFQACSEYLIDKGYCEASRLGIRGGSNGGLLVAACANQRPDLYGCVISDVGVLDMLRFHRFTVGHAWIPEYGDPDNVNDFEYLIRYSPLHNIHVPSEGTRQYPSLMLTTGDHDNRVSPLHTLKFLAELQHVMCSSSESQQTNPLVARIETKAGHGRKPTAAIINEITDTLSFMAACLKAEWCIQ